MSLSFTVLLVCPTEFVTVVREAETSPGTLRGMDKKKR